MRATVPAEIADDVVGWIGPDTLGVETTPVGSAAIAIAVYLDDPARALEVADDLRRCLAALGAAALAGPALGDIEDRRWVENYQAGLRPLPLGDRFVVVPGNVDGVPTDREPIVLVPGRAFGTGEHPTTRMCAAELEREVATGSRWLDLGTGSGVLAWIAVRCGAGRVRAVDVDPDAIAVAGHVVARNGGHPGIELAVGSASDEPDGAFDGVVANISEGYFLAEAAQIARVLRPGGTLVASGFLAEDAAGIEDRLRAAGFEIVRGGTEGPWASRVARRRP